MKIETLSPRYRLGHRHAALARDWLGHRGPWPGCRVCRVDRGAGALGDCASRTRGAHLARAARPRLRAGRDVFLLVVLLDRSGGASSILAIVLGWTPGAWRLPSALADPAGVPSQIGRSSSLSVERLARAEVCGVAEGTETEDQARRSREIGCDSRAGDPCSRRPRHLSVCSR